MSTNTTNTVVDVTAPATPTLYRAAPVTAALDKKWWRAFNAACAAASPPSYRRGDAERILITAGLADRWWGHAIIEAERAGGFSLYQEARSTCWSECAVGVAVAAAAPPTADYTPPREPADRELRRAGFVFSAAVAGDDFLRATRALGTIECRAAALAAA